MVDLFGGAGGNELNISLQGFPTNTFSYCETKQMHSKSDIYLE